MKKFLNMVVLFLLMVLWSLVCFTGAFYIYPHNSSAAFETAALLVIFGLYPWAYGIYSLLKR